MTVSLTDSVSSYDGILFFGHTAVRTGRKLQHLFCVNSAEGPTNSSDLGQAVVKKQTEHLENHSNKQTIKVISRSVSGSIVL